MDGIFVSAATLRRLPQSLREELLSACGVSGSAALKSPNVSKSPLDGPQPAEFTVAMTRRLVEDVSDQVRKVFRIMAELPSHEFLLSDITRPLGMDASDLMSMRGIWSGITKRTRRITEDPKATLIVWAEVGMYDGDDEYIDHAGRIAPMTHASLKQVFGL